MSVSIAFTLGGPAAAWADPPPEVVSTPADPSSPSQARAYTDALMDAIDRECRLTNNPAVGLNMLRYESCRESERDHIAATEPTGLFASRLGITREKAESRLALIEADGALRS
jgi:hypothetical protein